MRERDHDLEIVHLPVKGAAHRPTIVDTRDLFSTAAGTGSPAFFGRQGGVVTVGQVDIAHRPAPVDVAGVVRLVIGATFQ